MHKAVCGNCGKEDSKVILLGEHKIMDGPFKGTVLSFSVKDNYITNIDSNDFVNLDEVYDLIKSKYKCDYIESIHLDYACINCKSLNIF